MSRPINDSHIILDYYQGAYGPTIRIDIVSIESLYKMKCFFESLVRCVNSEVNLVNVENVISIGINQFILESRSNDKEDARKLVRLKKDTKDIIFHWRMSPADWHRVLSLTQRLVDLNHPGHQYLTEEGIDDALVELAFKERVQDKLEG